MNIYSIRDSKAEASLLPFCMRSRGEVTRAFGDACKKNDGSPLASHPEDYILFEIGTFDEQTGLVDAYKAPVSVCMGADFLPPPAAIKE